MELVNITDLCEIRIGRTPKRSEKRYWGKGYKWVTISDITSMYLETTKEEITETAVIECKMKPVPSNTVIMSFKLSLGKVAITKEELYTNEAIASFIIKDRGKIVPEYLYYALQSIDYDHLSDRAAKGTTLNKKKLSQIKIPYVDINRQQSIVNILNKANKLLTKRKEQISALSSLKQSIFLDMFGDPLLNPKKYPKAKLGDLCKIVRGGSPRPIKDFLGGTIPWIKISDGTKEDSIYITETKEKIIEEGIKKSRLVPKGSLIFANCGVSLGFARIITFDGCIHDGWLAFQDISDKLNDIFLLNLLNFFTKHFRSTAPDGTQPNLNTTIMKNFEVILPSIDLQNEYAQFITSLEGKNRKLVKSLKELENLKDALSNKAFNGELFND